MKKILVVVDMQNDFIDGSLGTPEAAGIVDRVVEKIQSYPIENVYATRDTHQANYLETLEGKHLPVEHCIVNTPGWHINDKVAKALSGAVIIDKPTFGSETLGIVIDAEAQGQEMEIELVGLCTDICVISNALLLKAKMPETEIYVDASCCAGVTPESHAAALQTMKMCQINVK